MLISRRKNSKLRRRSKNPNFFHFSVEIEIIKDLATRRYLIQTKDDILSSNRDSATRVIIGRTLGTRIRNLRLKTGLTQQQLANNAGMSRSKIEIYEQDKLINPNPLVIQKLAKILNIEPCQLIPTKSTTQDFYDYISPPVTLGSRIRNLRLRKGMLQKTLAQLLGVSNVTICRYEKDCSKPTPKISRRVARVLHTTAARLKA